MLRFPLMNHVARIVVAGVGGGGGNAVNRMIRDGMRGVDFAVIHTQAQFLQTAEAPHRIAIGTTGRGCGGDSALGCEAAEASTADLRRLLTGAELVFVAVALGGGTGSGAAPVVARLAREAGALTIGVATLPFSFEGSRRIAVARAGLTALQEHCHTVIVIPNDRLLSALDRRATIDQAFLAADALLREAVQGIADMINATGEINVDLADVRTVATAGKAAIVSTGRGRGPQRTRQAAAAALASNDLGIMVSRARGMLFNITAGLQVSAAEIEEAADLVRAQADPDVDFKFGWVRDETLEDDLRITLMATGPEHIIPALDVYERVGAIVDQARPPDPDAEMPTRRVYLTPQARRRAAEQAAAAASAAAAAESEPPRPRFSTRRWGIPAYLQ